MHLASVYARDLGVKVGKPVFYPHFFPIQDDKYIVIHNGIKVPAKTYSFWEEVIQLIKEPLSKHGIKIYQIGLEEEGILNGIDKRVITNNLKQTAFVIQNSMLMLGIDSVPMHIASAIDTPSVGLYAHTYANTCCPIWNKKSKAVVLESNRDGKKPSFSLEESPKTVDMIYPEVIAKAVLKQLKLFSKKTPLVKTIHMGSNYSKKSVDVILPPLLLGNYIPPINGSTIRMDLSFQPASLDMMLSSKPFDCVIKTDKPIDINIISKHKPSIKAIIYQTNKFEEEFVNNLRKLGIEFNMICNSPETLKEQRFKFFENEIHYFNEDEFIELQSNKIKSKVKSNQISFATKKIYLYGDQKIANLLDVLKVCGKPAKKDVFFIDADYMWIYTK